MRPMPSFAVSSTRAWLISSACARLSSAQGPAISASGLSLAIDRLPTWTVWMATMRPCLQGTPAKCHSVVAPCQKEGFKYLRCSASHFGHGSRNSIVGRAPVVRGKRDYAALVEGRAETEDVLSDP